MLAHNAAAAHGADAQLLVAALLPHLRTVIDIFVLPARLGVDGIGNHQGGAAGGIQLVAVVLFDDFNVVLTAQNAGSLFGKLDQHIDAQRHIGTAEDRCLFGGFLQNVQLLAGKPRGADDAGYTVLCAPSGGGSRPGGGGKINHNAAAGNVLPACVHGDISHAPRLAVHTGHNAAVRAGSNFFHKGAAHASVNALNDNVRHIGKFLSYFTKSARGVPAG